MKNYTDNSMIFEYIKERVPGRGKQKIGVIVGTVITGRFEGSLQCVIVTGWSKTNIKAGDEFDKDIGIEMALMRAAGKLYTPSLPPQMREQMREFQIRCLHYFKQAKLMSTRGPLPFAQ